MSPVKIGTGVVLLAVLYEFPLEVNEVKFVHNSLCLVEGPLLDLLRSEDVRPVLDSQD